MNRFLQNIGLGKIFLTILSVILILLLLVAALGVKQYFLYRHCEQIVLQSNKLLFNFTSLKEHISNTLLAEKKIEIGPLQRELQDLDKDLKLIIDDILIPEDLKLSFISQIDLLNLVVQLRTLQEEPLLKVKHINQLSETLRVISGRLQKFDTLLGAHTRSLLFGLHRVVAGTLALVLVIVVTILLLLYRYIASPITTLCRELNKTIDPDEDIDQPSGTLTTSIDALSKRINEYTGLQSRLYNLQACLDNLHRTLPGPLQKEEDWESLCLTLQTNPDYFLVWAGKIVKGEKEMTVIGCGCESCSASQCRDTVDHLIKYCHQDDGLCQSARQAVEKGSVVTGVVPASSVPDMLHSSIPGRTRYIHTASFPITGDPQEPTIVTLYSITPSCFGKIETGLLRFIFQRLALENRIGITTNTAFQTLNPALYQYSIIGALADDLASEMTNIANGALNYSQALFDLAEEKNSDSEERMLLAKLREEEQKLAGLAATMQKIGLLHSGQSAEKVHIPALVKESLAVFSGILKKEHIKAEKDLSENLPRIHAVKGPLQSVLFTLLYSTINEIRTGGHGEIKPLIRLTGRLEAEKEAVSLTITPCQVMEGEKNIGWSPWPNGSACEEMLRQSGGKLLFRKQKGNTQPSCSIILPIGEKSKQ